jgi:acyl-CoA synthetase (AMP-forming)/AMP-acid ligase II
MNLAYLLTRTAKLYGSRPATFHGDSVQNYSQIHAQVSRLASGLAGLGLARGDRVGLILENDPRGLVAMFGPLRAGMAIVPMNPKLHPSEHAFMLNHSEARALIGTQAAIEGIQALGTSFPAGFVFICIGATGSAPADAIDFDRLLKQSSDNSSDISVGSDDLAWVFYTSGTTGRPKGAMLSHRNLMTMVATQLIEFNPVQPSDRLVYMAPLSHSNGLMAFQHVARGAGHVFPKFSGFRTGPFYDLVQEHKVTTAFMVPTMIQMMLDDPSHRERDISSLHTIMYGGAPMYVDRLKDAISTFGKIFVQGFAQGEAPMGCTCLPKHEHDLDTAAHDSRLASAGRECMLVEVRIFDDDDQPVAQGQPGEIVVRGDLVMLGYLRDPDATALALRNGWLHTGDIGYLDADGYLFITDRKKDMIISGGSNIYPRELEEVLYRHPAIHEATVFGIPDPKWGERVVAAVVVKDEHAMDEKALIQWCLDHLASYKKPSEVRFLPELPKSGYGKILKRETRKLAFPEL